MSRIDIQSVDRGRCGSGSSNNIEVFVDGLKDWSKSGTFQYPCTSSWAIYIEGYAASYKVPGNEIYLNNDLYWSGIINQWNVNIYVKDSVTNAPVSGATVTAGTQSKQTDAAGYVQLRITEGTIDITISKTGYNTFTATEYVFADKTVNYPLSPAGIATGNIQFVSVPSNAEIFIDGVDQAVKTPTTITNLSSGDHIYKLVLLGYQDATGTFTIEPGQTTTVSVLMAKTAEGGGAGTLIGIGLIGAGVLGAVILTTRETKYMPPKMR